MTLASRARWAIVGLTGIVLAPLANNGLPTFDDKLAILENTSRWALFSTDKGAFEPLGWLALALLHAAFGLAPWAYHAASLAAHAACAVLVFELARSLYPTSKNSLSAAAAAALFFALHPLQVQAVAQAASLGDVLAALFGLAALRAHLSGKPRATLAFFTASALCHWQAVVLPVLIVALELRAGRRPKLKALAPLLGVAAALFAATVYVKLSYESGQTHVIRPANLVRGAAWFLRKTILPLEIPTIEFLYGPYSKGVGVVPCAALLAAAGLLAWLRKDARAAFACWLLLLAPTHLLTSNESFYVVSRWGYLALAAPALLFGALVLRARPAALALLALLPLAAAQAKVFKDPLSILAHDLSIDPDHGAFFLKTPRDRAELGAHLIQAGYKDVGEGQIRKALSADPSLLPARVDRDR